MTIQIDCHARPEQMPPAIVLAAFGASSAEARRAYDHIHEVVRRHKPGHEVFWAFTSRRVVARLRAEGVVLPTLEETNARLRQSGHKRAVVLPLLTVSGEEYVRVAEYQFDGIRATCCRALLSGEADIPAILDALDSEFHANAVNVLVCHGNGKHDSYNDLLLALGRALESAYPNCIAASVEGRPGRHPLERARASARRSGRANFVPFMVVAGEHVTNDVMGKGADSWKSQVGAATSTCARPLGWNDAALRLFLDRLDEGLARLEKEQCDESR
jgi:sirohydrochlorin cobaltochelatase